jgi:hypothetical protein
MTRDEWYEELKTAPQEKKDQALSFAVENLEYEQVGALIRAGGELNGGIQMFEWALRRTDDMKLANIMLDCGWRCPDARYKDLWFFWDEDKEQAYRTLGRMLNAGMSEDERYKAAAGALKKGDFSYLDAYIVRPGEDMAKMINQAGWGRENVANDPDDTRDISHLDVENYVAWRNSVTELYDASFAGGVTEQKLKDTVSADGMTGLMLAVRAGKFGEVDSFYKSHPGLNLDVDTVTKEDKYGQTVLSLMGQRLELQKLFAPHFWSAQPEDALEILSALPGMYRGQVDAAEIGRASAQSRQLLRAGAKP